MNEYAGSCRDKEYKTPAFICVFTAASVHLKARNPEQVMLRASQNVSVCVCFLKKIYSTFVVFSSTAASLQEEGKNRISTYTSIDNHLTDFYSVYLSVSVWKTPTHSSHQCELWDPSGQKVHSCVRGHRSTNNTIHLTSLKTRTEPLDVCLPHKGHNMCTICHALYYLWDLCFMCVRMREHCFC